MRDDVKMIALFKFVLCLCRKRLPRPMNQKNEEKKLLVARVNISLLTAKRTDQVFMSKHVRHHTVIE